MVYKVQSPHSLGYGVTRGKIYDTSVNYKEGRYNNYVSYKTSYRKGTGIKTETTNTINNSILYKSYSKKDVVRRKERQRER